MTYSCPKCHSSDAIQKARGLVSEPLVWCYRCWIFIKEDGSTEDIPKTGIGSFKIRGIGSL
jgi:hypothetical protein